MSFFFSFLSSFLSFLFAVIFAIIFASCGQRRSQHGAPDCSGQLRTSTGSSRLQWAAPDLTLLQWAAPDLTGGALERTGQRRTSPGELLSGVGSAGPQLPEDMSKDMSEEMPEDMSEDMSKDMSEKNVRKNVRRNCRRNV